jgi:hypothetical protein
MDCDSRTGPSSDAGLSVARSRPSTSAGYVNFTAYTSKCQGEANSLLKPRAIERYRPSLVVWGSTDETASILAATPSGSKVLNEGSPAWRSVMLHRMNDRVGRFIATGARVILLLEPPAVHVGNITEAVSNSAAYEEMNSLLREVAARHPHDVAVVNLQSLLCASGPPCPYVVHGIGSLSHPRQAIRPDGVHYLPAGSLWVARWLVPQIASAGRKLS